MRYLNFAGGLNTGTSDFLLNDSELYRCKNCWAYIRGRLQKVPGYEKCVVDQVVTGKNVDYLHYYYDTANRTDYLLACSDSGANYTVEYRTTGNWAAAGSIGATWDTYAGSQPMIANFLGKAFIVGYKSGTTFLPNATINGTTFSAADTDITSMPQGKYVITYRDLLYVLHSKTGGTVYPSRGYYCDEPLSGAIGWTNLDTRYVEFGYSDGDEITGCCVAFDRLLVFKENSIWSYDEVERKQIADIGCHSFKSIQVVNGIPYWFNRRGYYRLTQLGATPELVSEKARLFTDSILVANHDRVFAGIYENDEYRSHMGHITVDGYTYRNAWWCFNTLTGHDYIRCSYWAETSYEDELHSACTYTESGKKRLYFGNQNGYVFKFATVVDEVYTDDTYPIDSFFITKALDHGIPEMEKFSNHATFFTKYATGMKVAVEKDNSGVYSDDNVPIINGTIVEADLNANAKRFRYKFYEQGSSKSWYFEGMTLQTNLEEDAK